MKLTRHGLLTALLVVAALLVGSLVREFMFKADLLAESPFIHEAAVGEAVPLRTAEVTVTGVQPAKRVEIWGSVAESAGVWLVADVVLDPVGAPATLGGSDPVVVSADGREFGGAQAVINNCGPTQPGLPVACQLPFEVPADALAGAKLLIPADTRVDGSDDVAAVDLGIDEATAALWGETDEQIKLQQTTGAVR